MSPTEIFDGIRPRRYPPSFPRSAVTSPAFWSTSMICVRNLSGMSCERAISPAVTGRPASYFIARWIIARIAYCVLLETFMSAFHPPAILYRHGGE
jgi:hypothetical protein